MEKRQTVILGGGLAGLAAAGFSPGDVVVLEAASRPGGLCRSFECRGFVYDIGGHILFSHDSELLKDILEWLEGNLVSGRRNNQIWYRERFVKYPFENGIFSLAPAERLEILLSFLGRRRTEAANLDEWFRSRFGDALAEKYLLPYNKKIWKRSPDRLSLLWVARVPDPPLEDIARAAVGIETEGYLHQLNFAYPARGGIEALIASLASGVEDLRMEFPVESLVEEDGGWRIVSRAGELWGKTVISTIPVFNLLEVLEDVPGEVRSAAAALQYNSLITVMVGIGTEALKGKTAIYIPDPRVFPHRVCYMSQFSAANAPPGCSHLVAEITVPPDHPLLKASDSFLAETVVAQTGDICGYTPDEVVATEVRRFPHAYVVYDLEYEANRNIVFDHLAARGIRTAGRFGSFRYLNMDACVADGRRVASGRGAES
ncbi:MAG TPA: FAD-dependent oxidoreductase [bacterium]|nr:FAD-dependent oxidoreductase [bacterium]HPJ71076.1 FAD-dependent oxidoreductase [bacterium]HPQ65186.1 FAD-dependent oxidoreductase [bacterium]